MMSPHNGKIVTIDQLTHYKSNHSANINNILPLVRASLDDFLVVNISPGLFQDPSMLGTYQGAPPFLKPSFSAQLCVVSSKGTNIKYKTPITESPPHIEVPPVEEILPQEFPESAIAPLVTDLPPLQGKILVWETVPQDITQIPFFYPPPGVKAFQVAASLTLPNMVLAISEWYLHLPSLPPQTEGLLIQISLQDPSASLPPPTGRNTTTITGR
jgi:hypothetical protein